MPRLPLYLVVAALTALIVVLVFEEPTKMAATPPAPPCVYLGSGHPPIPLMPEGG